jgi:hypothetical protein
MPTLQSQNPHLLRKAPLKGILTLKSITCSLDVKPHGIISRWQPYLAMARRVVALKIGQELTSLALLTQRTTLSIQAFPLMAPKIVVNIV